MAPSAVREVVMRRRLRAPKCSLQVIVLQVCLAVNASGGTRALEEEGGGGGGDRCLGLAERVAMASSLAGLIIITAVGHLGGRWPLRRWHLEGQCPCF